MVEFDVEVLFTARLVKVFDTLDRRCWAGALCLGFRCVSLPEKHGKQTNS